LRLWHLFFLFWNRLLKVQNEKLGHILGKFAIRFDKWYLKKTKYGHACRQIVIKKN
jgi:hypothetical protein